MGSTRFVLDRWADAQTSARDLSSDSVSIAPGVRGYAFYQTLDPAWLTTEAPHKRMLIPAAVSFSLFLIIFEFFLPYCYLLFLEVFIFPPYDYLPLLPDRPPVPPGWPVDFFMHICLLKIRPTPLRRWAGHMPWRRGGGGTHLLFV